jgi:hypothetical protein
VASARTVEAAYADAERLALPSDDSDDDGGYAQRHAQSQRPPRSQRSRGRSAGRSDDDDASERDEFMAARLARAEQPRVPAHYECQMQ